MGVDIGTSAVKAVITNAEGKIYGSCSVANDVNFLKPGWVEQNPEIHWWKNFIFAVKGCLKKSRIPPNQIAGLGISGLSVNLTALDKNGKVIRPAILYMDTRALKEIEWLKENVGNQTFLEINGNPISHRMLVPKILWFKKHEPENYNKTWKILISSQGYVIYKLCGQITADYYTADMVGLFSYRENKWSNKLSELIGIDIDKLPQAFPSYEVVGEISTISAKQVGLKAGTPVVAGSCDANISTLSSGVVYPGEAMLSYGSVGASYICLDKPKVHPGLFFGHYVKPNSWVSVIAMQCAGAILKWFYREFGHIEKEFSEKLGLNPYQILDMEAEKIPPGSNGLIVLPYFMGERSPIMDPNAKGVIFGLNLFHSRAHVYRAFLEAFGYGLSHHLDVLNEIGVKIKRWIAVNGGAKSKIWRQIVSDITGIPQYYTPGHPGAPLGDAFLAAIGTKVIRDWSKIKEWVHLKDETLPNMEKHRLYRKLYTIYKRLYEHLKQDMWDLSNICNI